MTTDDRQNQSLHPRGLSLNQLKSAIYDLCYTTDPLLRHIAMQRKKKINNANDSSVKFKILIPDEPLIQL